MSSRHCEPPAWTIPARPTPITVTPSCADSSFSQEAVRQKRVLCGVRRWGLLSQSVSASCETLQTPPVDSDSVRDDMRDIGDDADTSPTSDMSAVREVPVSLDQVLQCGFGTVRPLFTFFSRHTYKNASYRKQIAKP